MFCLTSSFFFFITVVADFTPRLGIITIPPGITTFPVSINITDDAVSEPVERFTAHLMLLPQTTRGIMLGTPSTTVVQISDNDGKLNFRYLHAYHLVLINSQLQSFYCVLISHW